MALIALEVCRRIEIVVMARRDVLVGQKVRDVETDDLSGIVVCCSSFDTLHESWHKTEISSACKPHKAVECPDCNAAPEEAIKFSFKDFKVATTCQYVGDVKHRMPLTYK